VGSNRDMIQAFVSGQLSDADHDLMSHHISACQECAAAVAAERVVRAEMAKLTASADTPPAPAAALGEPPVVGLPPALSADMAVPSAGQVTDSGSAPVSGDADMLSGSVVHAGDLSVPPVPELQLDFILDRTSEGAGVLLHHEMVREVALDQLPPAPAHSGRRSHREEDTEAGGGIEIARAGYSDDTELAAATMAGIADSVAHAAAALASSGPPEPLEAEVQKPVAVEAAAETVEPGPMPVEAAAETVEPEPMSVEAGAETVEPEPMPVDVAPIVGVSEPILTEDTAIIEEQESAAIQDAAMIAQQESAAILEAAIVEEQESSAVEAGMASEDQQPVHREGAVPEDSHPVQVKTAAVIAPAAPAVGAGGGLLRWSAAAALLVVAAVAVYAATQVRSSPVANAAAPDRMERVLNSELQWLTTPSVLTPILDSAVYSRVLDVTLVADSLADSLDAGIGYDPFAGEMVGDTTAPPAAVAGAQSTRSADVPERLPQTVSDPPDIDDGQGSQLPGEVLPEVVTGNAPARTTARGSAVVISGVPDTSRLLRTTTHWPRPDVAYVLREYDASASEPAPRAGVNEYRWSDETGSRLYVLSGPVDVTELRAYAGSLQTQGR
jgi:hypothetical protein